MSVCLVRGAGEGSLGGDRPTIIHRRDTRSPKRLRTASPSAKRSDTTGDQLTYKASIKAERVGIPKGLVTGPFRELTTGEIKRWLAALVLETADREERRRAQATANRHWNLLRAILNSAYENEPERVPSADAWRRVRPFENVDRPRTRTITAAEARELIKCLPRALRALAQASLYTGLRLGEIQALRAEDFSGDAIHVSHSKSGRSRAVPLTDEGVQFFETCVGNTVVSDVLFEPVSRINVSRGMRAGCIAAKISPPATFHDLRRTYGSLLLNSGAPADVIQELLGHADLRMTRRAYAHMLDRTLRRAVTKHLPSFIDGGATDHRRRLLERKGEKMVS